MLLFFILFIPSILGEAENDLMKNIPGVTFQVNFKTYSGYLNAGNNGSWRMHYMQVALMNKLKGSVSTNLKVTQILIQFFSGWREDLVVLLQEHFLNNLVHFMPTMTENHYLRTLTLGIRKLICLRQSPLLELDFLITLPSRRTLKLMMTDQEIRITMQ